MRKKLDVTFTDAINVTVAPGMAELQCVQEESRRLRHPLAHDKAVNYTEETDPGGVPESVPECGLVFIWLSKIWKAF